MRATMEREVRAKSFSCVIWIDQSVLQRRNTCVCGWGMSGTSSSSNKPFHDFFFTWDNFLDYCCLSPRLPSRPCRTSPFRGVRSPSPRRPSRSTRRRTGWPCTRRRSWSSIRSRTVSNSEEGQRHRASERSASEHDKIA